jgi:hypothetical protein
MDDNEPNDIDTNSDTQDDIEQDEQKILAASQAADENLDDKTKPEDLDNSPKNIDNIIDVPKKSTSFFGSVLDFTSKALIAASYVAGGCLAYIHRDKIMSTLKGGWPAIIAAVGEIFKDKDGSDSASDKKDRSDVAVVPDKKDEKITNSDDQTIQKNMI